MGQKVHPIGFRLGVFRTWNARWFAKSDYKKYLQEDFRIREFLGKRLEKAEIASMNIERAGDSVRVEVH